MKTSQYNNISLFEELKEVAAYLWSRGWAEKHAGNISILLPGKPGDKVHFSSKESRLKDPVPELGGKYLFITASGKRMRDVAKDPARGGLFLQINAKGTAWNAGSISAEPVQPSSELPSHLAIHQLISARGGDERVVLHAHPTELIILTQNPAIRNSEDLSKILWSMHAELMMFIPKGVGLLPYMLPGNQVIATATLDLFRVYDMVVWAKHGALAIGKDLRDTFDQMDIACKAAQIWLQCKASGFEPEGFTDEQLKELRDCM